MIVLFVFDAQADDSDYQIKCLAYNIYFESRGEKLDGKIAVALVTMNRVNSPKFPNTVCEVVHQADMVPSWKNPNKLVPKKYRCQFSWYCDGVKDIINDEEAYRTSVIIAHTVYRGFYRNKDITEGALFYHSNEVDPWWNKHYDKTVTIGNHHFYASR